jgi:cytochrome c556
MRRPTAWLVIAAGLALIPSTFAAPRAQETTAPPPKTVVPLAASSLAADPDAHYGEYVTLMGAIEKRFSRSVFSVDQDPAGHPRKDALDVLDVLIIAPTLNSEITLNAYVTVIGDVFRFEPAEVARLAKDYTLDLSQDAVEQYRGRPAILATAVINAAMVDLARRLPPPMTDEEAAFSKVMKRIGPAFTALRQAIGGSTPDVTKDATKENSTVLKHAFAEAEAFWTTRRKADAIGWARDARQHADSIERSAAAGNWDAVKASTTALGQICQSCHTAYREKFDDGTFRIKREK